MICLLFSLVLINGRGRQNIGIEEGRKYMLELSK
jgi:hypothetical protein